MRAFSFLSAFALIGAIVALDLALPRAEAQTPPRAEIITLPSIRIANVQRLQPGWVRVYLSAANAPAGATYQFSQVCAAPTNPSSIVTTQSNGANLAFDIQVNAAWLAENSLPAPCHITQMSVSMMANGQARAWAQLTLDLAMDLPLSLVDLTNTSVNPAGTTVSLAPNTAYAAYPPLLVAVYSPATQRTGLAEVEELTARGTVGLRALSVFDNQGNLWRELGGGGEILPGWGLDINTLGIWRAPQLAVEISNLWHDVFPYQMSYAGPLFQLGTIEPPILAPSAQTPYIFPAPDSSDYSTYVLNNRGVPRCATTPGCMDFTYNATTHTLNAVNGANISLITPPAIQLGAQTAGPELSRFPIVVNTPLAKTGAELLAASKTTIHTIDPALTQKILAVAQALSSAPGRNLSLLEAMPSALTTSRARMASNASTRDRSLLLESPQEAAISKIVRIFPKGWPMGTTPAASCVVNAAKNGVTSTPAGCLGLTGHEYACPTLSDPIKVESLLPPGQSNGLATALNGTIPPYYAGRDNIYGTCGSHAATQYAEALLDKYTDDLAIKRVIYVNGDAIVVPQPRVALSVTGGLVQLYTWSNTHTGDPAPPTPPKSGTGLPNPPPITPHILPPKWPDTLATETNAWPPSGPSFPNFPEAYWAAREGDWGSWTQQNAQVATPPCNGHFWGDGFCLGQGHPPIGAYYSYSQMVKSLNGNPLSDPPWSLADSYFDFPMTDMTSALNDPDGGIQAVIAQINGGLPVLLSFPSGTSINTPDGSGGTLSLFNGLTWYLPPELGACDASTLNAVFGPDVGHYVNIVGYWITGTAASPDPFSSYFIIENNWGKTQGYHSFNFMNFAAFKYLANGLQTYRLGGACQSVACATRPQVILPPGALDQLKYPPLPGSPSDTAYTGIIDQARAGMGGVFGPSAQPEARATPAWFVK
jgi:hypothetical protein